jgi:hypothetical protein
VKVIMLLPLHPWWGHPQATNVQQYNSRPPAVLYLTSGLTCANISPWLPAWLTAVSLMRAPPWLTSAQAAQT